MRVITLPSDEKEARGLFSILFTAAFQGDGAKSHSAARTLAKLQDAMEAVTHEETDSEVGKIRVLNEGVDTLTLEDAHYELLKERMFGAGVPWMAAAARRVNSAYELLENAEEVRPSDKPEGKGK